MTCKAARLQLAEYREGALAPTAQRRVRRHLEACELCRDQLRRQDHLQAALATLPKRVIPDSDLWPGIHSRIAAPTLDSPNRKPRARRLVLIPVSAAALACLLVVFFGRFGAFSNVAGRNLVALRPFEQTLRRFDRIEREYAQIRAAFSASIQDRSGMVTTELVEVVEANLLTIERAIAEIKLALESSPGNQELIERLADVYRARFAVLNTARELLMES